jgi:hypothetical protein
MTVQGTTVVQVIAPTREQQLERELVDAYAALEMKQALLEEAHQALALVTPGAPSQPLQTVVCTGGGLVGEADGWLWLMRGGVLTRLWRAPADEVEQAKALRDIIERELEARAIVRRSVAS